MLKATVVPGSPRLLDAFGHRLHGRLQHRCNVLQSVGHVEGAGLVPAAPGATRGKHEPGGFLKWGYPQLSSI